MTLLSLKYRKHQTMQTKWIKSLDLCFFQVRREKISERMKYLQDLVPGCSKVRKAPYYFLSREIHAQPCAMRSSFISRIRIGLPNAVTGLLSQCVQVTGKAVMLDEIINYVQSLQRQIEVPSSSPPSLPRNSAFFALVL